MIFKNLKLFTCIIVIISISANSINASDECFEGTSRAIFKFNNALDDAVIGPLARSYNKLPEPVKAGTSNFTSNISMLLSIPNNLLQGNFEQLGQSVGSFVINSSVGILGIFNPAEKMGLKPHKEDVGQTLGSYGMGPGCYFVLPVLGPTTVRDSIGMFADSFVDPFAHITIREKELLGTSGTSLDFFTVKGTSAIDFRADNDASFDNLEKNSIDYYSSLKSIYLQDRENKIKNSTDSQDDWGSLDN
jgi:phospholipid-binding lipoprotein MlaA